MPFTGNGVVSQLSILELDQSKIRTLIEGTVPSPPVWTNEPSKAGQGFGLSQPERKQIELRAMTIARELYELQGWTVVDKSSSQPYDFYATRNEDNRYVEVKGTTGNGCSVILTDGEVKHLRKNRHSSALVIISNIILTECEGTTLASGGEVSTHIDPWVIDENELEPTQYRYWIKRI